jgi:adenosylcobinamide kinase/adenosylcobinamide-phosphate guanylyltransferase
VNTARGPVLILGGARSGKSAFDEELVNRSGLSRTYVATGRAFDAEMEDRIGHHQARRGEGWTTIEEPLRLVDVLRTSVSPDTAVLVDCLTLWVTNLMMDGLDIEKESAALADCLRACSGPVVLVSNEVGMGIVPENRMAREFRDHAGRLHQQIARIADEVWFIAAGLPLKMKG